MENRAKTEALRLKKYHDMLADAYYNNPLETPDDIQKLQTEVGAILEEMNAVADELDPPNH